ncbi:MAG: DUF4918 family protein [Saprospiraceae bacterium]|nr:DUF4918 family protein [Bacteroidia bacterium]NNE15117.1 DUF4918 family protein [Saprospiraceae bacterium]NNL91767.1 DUF4918 family protein [Saprospiraceae bacterium]
MQTFAHQVLDFYKNLSPKWKLPKSVDLLYPYSEQAVWNLMVQFYNKYYDDSFPRTIVFGINPGRLGAGMTGVPFTDPVRLESVCKIKNEVQKRQELSSVFIYEMIDQFNSPENFYSKIYISSICPLGFIKDGKNYNYYDSKELYQAVEKKIVNSIKKQLTFNCKRDKAFSLGQGKNFKVLKDLNKRYKWFEEVIPLPHPRWVMQYKLKSKEKYLNEYVEKLGTVF